MKTQCIKVTLQENPLNVLKGCSALLSELDKSSSENIYIDHAISLIGDLITDAVSILEDEENKDKNKEKEL